MVFACCVPMCKNTSKSELLHRFPHSKDELLIYEQWIAKIGRQDLEKMDPIRVYNNYRVCDQHFEPECKINRTELGARSRSRASLRKGACPTLLMPRSAGLASAQPSISSDMTIPATSSAGKIGEIEVVKAGRTETSDQMETPVDEPVHVADVAMEQKLSPAEMPSHIVLHPSIAKTTKRIRGRKDARRRLNLLQAVNLTRAAQLTPRAKSLYHIAGKLKKLASSMREENVCMKERLKSALHYSESEEYFESKVNRTTVNFLLSQLKMQKKDPKGRRYTLDDKVFALSLMKQSPRGYRLLQKVFALPSRKTLNTLLRRVPFHTGINNNIMHSLRSSVSKMPLLDRYAVLMWDEISLESALVYNEHDDGILGFEDCGNEGTAPKIADHAMVFMLRGIRQKWKQPIAYFFSEATMSAADLKRNIKSVVRAVRNIGIKVVATISDQLTTNCSVISSLEADTARWCAVNNVVNHFFGYVIDGEEIVHIYDPPHLLKGIRNNMLENLVKFKWKQEKTQVAAWTDVIHLYEHDSREEDDYKMCSRLTDEHVYTDKMKKMKVKFAAQIFSQRVSAVMHAIGQTGAEGIPHTYNDTSDFLLFMDKLFDSVNGSAIHPIDGKRLRVAIGSDTEHLKFWEEALPVLRSMRFVTSSGKEFVPPSVKNWEKSIRGLRYLWTKLSKEGFSFLSLRNFNQDPLENYFSLIRSHGIRNINPSPAAFKASFKSLLINNFTATHSPGSNCEEDNAGNALHTLRNFLSLPTVEGVEELCDISDARDTFVMEDTHSPLKLQLHGYLAGYLAKQVFKHIKCRSCRQAILADESEKTDQYLIHARAYNPRALIYTNKPFRTVFTRSCQVLHHYLPQYCHKQKVGKLLISQLLTHLANTLHFSCTDHNVLYEFARLMTRFYIFTWTANINKILRGVETKDINDNIKKMAFEKCKKRKGRIAKLRQTKRLV